MTALPRLETTPSACPACAVVPSVERLAALSAAASGRGDSRISGRPLVMICQARVSVCMLSEAANVLPRRNSSSVIALSIDMSGDSFSSVTK